MLWADRLLQYDFRVENVPGKSNPVADMLARQSVESAADYDMDSGDTARFLPVFGNPHLAVITPTELATSTQSDKILLQIIYLIKTGWPSKVSSN